MSLNSIRSEAEFDEAVASGTVVVYKHSTRCGVSAAAYEHVEAFAKSHRDTPVCVIDVLKSRPLSDAVAARFGIRHESPQVIVFRDGEPVWNASHFKITRDTLAEQVATATG